MLIDKDALKDYDYKAHRQQVEDEAVAKFGQGYKVIVVGGSTCFAYLDDPTGRTRLIGDGGNFPGALEDLRQMIQRY